MPKPTPTDMTTPHARLAAALAEMTSPTANRSNPAFKGSKYATLDHILDHVRPILGKHGLGLTQPVYNGEGRVGVKTCIVHPEGVIELGEISISIKPDTSAQRVGADLTYLRRQSIQAALGIATDLDDDGNEAAGTTTATPAARTWIPRA